MSKTSKVLGYKTVDAFMEECLREKPPEEVKTFYANWAANYDKEVNEFDYNGPKIFAEAFAKLNVPRNAEIIDIAAGTGALGEKLNAMGYKYIDALDGTPEMLDIARKKNVYRNFCQFFLGCGYESPIKDGTYDVAISSGAIGQGHIPYDAFYEIIAMVKQGGLICWLTMNPSEGKVEENFKTVMADLTNSGKWKMFQEPIRTEEFFQKEATMFYVMQKL
ncbi:methyltransferase-like protein 27 [Limulus polyphemus]|uniref:Methyltransferase-like protein 27 n=1 Tax=Limulus polyphemus TaxID=6850 RepID=A0ABM1C627_LIMPO|nr:methyltransferase-like protein 27 [Limulus polyphemus]XP_022238230.1 methyltransferase-like protein 27 [Limulus polyphemus]XP_022238231.1 methyltransferase-like protein 27 [Limulus polyphemus]